MDLWNDYEGKTIAGKFLLEKLLYPEGRNGYFVAKNGTGKPTVIRLTESLNDQEETLDQWRIVRDLNHPNLVVIRSYGQIVLDDSPLVYVVLEAPDSTLADILKERPMTLEETREIATSLVPALDALHRAGLMHGWLEPASVVAVGEVIKLRSDCVRRLPEGQDGSERMAADVRCFAGLLAEALTGERNQGSAALLPAPFDAIVANAISGSWGLHEISRALDPHGPSKFPPPPPPAAVEEFVVIDELPPTAAPEIPPAVAETTDTAYSPESGQEGEPWPRRKGPWIALLGVAGILILALVYFIAHGAARPPATQQVSAPALPAQNSPEPSQPVTPAQATAQPATEAAPGDKVPTSPIESTARRVWRVVAFTYNRQDQAQTKVSSIERRHSSMQPEVFSPDGKAPFLVTLGGAMDHEEALALKRKALTEGFPRDTYVQNYSGK